MCNCGSVCACMLYEAGEGACDMSVGGGKINYLIIVTWGCDQCGRRGLSQITERIQGQWLMGTLN